MCVYIEREREVDAHVCVYMCVYVLLLIKYYNQKGIMKSCYILLI